MFVVAILFSASTCRLSHNLEARPLWTIQNEVPMLPRVSVLFHSCFIYLRAKNVLQLMMPTSVMVDFSKTKVQTKLKVWCHLMPSAACAN